METDDQLGVFSTRSAWCNNVLKDFPVCEPPSDSVSALEFTPKTAPFNGLCAASWDQTVRVWEVDSSSKTATPKSLQKMSAPLLDASWNGDGNRIYASDCNGSVFEWNLDANHVSQRKCHAAGVRACRWLWTPKTPLLMTASWDKTVKFWDTRVPQSVVSINLPERCFAADVLYPLAVVGCAGQKILTYSVQNGFVEVCHDDPSKLSEQHLRQQLRAVAVLKGNNRPSGYVAVTTNGLMYVGNIPHISGIQTSAGYKLECHRTYSLDGSSCDIYAVNDVRVHPIHGGIATVGSDRKFNFWNKDKGSNTFKSAFMDQAITKCAISSDGMLFAYALGYDWSMGHEHCDQSLKPQIFFHPCLEDMRPK
ncbi:mRNA export factor-like [Drosophila miranda]|uniref:mRNA export factor-like n=1 Tax=Drosophila miranda TaxID=7229 RepID=UPI00143F21D6|nr:mRNA export factor-like [Drosophila miranda]